METNQIKRFLQMQFCLLLLALTCLPTIDAVQMISGVSIDYINTLLRVIGLVGSGILMYKFYVDWTNQKKQLPIPFLALAGSGMLLVAVDIFMSELWVSIIAGVLLLIAVCKAKEAFEIDWKTTSVAGAYLILLAVLLRFYNNVDPSIFSAIFALVGLIMYLKGLGMLKQDIGTLGQQGVSNIKTAIILSIIGYAGSILFSWIPAVNIITSIIFGIVLIVSLVFELMGYIKLSKCTDFGTQGMAGANKVKIGLIIGIIASVIGFIPLMGIFESILAVVVMFLIVNGWMLIISGLYQFNPAPTEVAENTAE
jgi:hypothetical protein